MDLNALPQISDRLFLADISGDFRLIEGEIPHEECAWVRVRTATVADHAARAGIEPPRDVRYIDQDLILAAAETIRGNPQRIAAYEVYATLEEVGNLTRDGQPLFPRFPVRDLPRETFDEVWAGLPIAVSLAIQEAVRLVNPAWSD